jgi:hypothetical protein
MEGNIFAPVVGRGQSMLLNPYLLRNNSNEISISRPHHQEAHFYHRYVPYEPLVSMRTSSDERILVHMLT